MRRLPIFPIGTMILTRCGGIIFAIAQGAYLAFGGRYVRYGSARVSNALADATRQAGGEIS